MIGISFYLNDPLAEERIIQAAKAGVKRGFTSLHIPEESGSLAEKARRLLRLANEHGMDVYADVSLRTPEHLGIKNLFSLKELGVSGLRLDDFFDNELILELAKEFKLAVNASILFEEDIQNLLNGGLDPAQLIAWHNFYPRCETGLGLTFFRKQNELFRRLGIPVLAYVPGAGEKRGPLHDGLPTLEDHRYSDPFCSALELFSEGVAEVYIGDPDPGAGLLEKLLRFDIGQEITIRTEGGFLKQGVYRLRPDASRDVLRFMDTREKGPVPPANTVSRPAGSITIDNDGYGRYRGELQIALTDLPADERVNVIGYVHPEDLPLLRFLAPGMSVVLS